VASCKQLSKRMEMQIAVQEMFQEIKEGVDSVYSVATGKWQVAG